MFVCLSSKRLDVKQIFHVYLQNSIKSWVLSFATQRFTQVDVCGDGGSLN